MPCFNSCAQPLEIDNKLALAEHMDSSYDLLNVCYYYAMLRIYAVENSYRVLHLPVCHEVHNCCRVYMTGLVALYILWHSMSIKTHDSESRGQEETAIIRETKNT